MSGLLIFLLVIAAVGLALGFLFRHRSGRIARGLGAASRAQNEFYGFGSLPPSHPESLDPTSAQAQARALTQPPSHRSRLPRQHGTDRDR